MEKKTKRPACAVWCGNFTGPISMFSYSTDSVRDGAFAGPGYCQISRPGYCQTFRGNVSDTNRTKFVSGATINRNDVTVVGDRNTVVGNDAVVYGDDNVVIGNDAKVYGIRNRVNGNDAEVHGDYCSVIGNDCEVEEMHCSITGCDSKLKERHVDLSKYPRPTESKEKDHRKRDREGGHRQQPPPEKVREKEQPKKEDMDIVSMTEMGKDDKAGTEPACVVCLENKKQLAPTECKHLCLCFGCAKKLIDMKDSDVKCPLCNIVIKRKMIRIYA